MPSVHVTVPAGPFTRHEVTRAPLSYDAMMDYFSGTGAKIIQDELRIDGYGYTIVFFYTNSLQSVTVRHLTAEETEIVAAYALNFLKKGDNCASWLTSSARGISAMHVRCIPDVLVEQLKQIHEDGNHASMAVNTSSPISYFKTEIATDIMWQLGSAFILYFPEHDWTKLRGLAFWHTAGAIIKNATPVQLARLKYTIMWIDQRSAWTGITAAMIRDHIEKAKELS